MSLVLPFAGRIEVAGLPVGSGCVVHSSGLVVTCWHVVSPHIDSIAELSFFTIDNRYKFPVRIVGQPDLQHDLVLLQPTGGTRLPALTAARLLAGESALPGDLFTIQGFGEVEDSDHSYQFLSATGKIIGPAQRDGIVLLEVESRQVLRGMSGAGVVLDAHDGIVGVLSGRYVPSLGEGWLRDTGWVVPAEHIAALRTDLLAAVSLGSRSSRLSERQSIWQVRGLHRAAVFAGREKELNRLNDLLPSGSSGSVVIAGVGGNGKTRLALEYAYLNRNNYDVVWLARADFLVADLRELAVSLGLDVAGLDDLETSLNGWLASHTRWLIMIDGADVPARINDRLPAGAGHVLITSRDAQWGNIANVLRLEMLDRSAAIGFLQQRGVQASNVDLDSLAAALGDLPLALEHAASFLLATQWRIREYLQLLHDRASELLTDIEIADYAMPIATTWRVSFDRLRKEDPASLEVLRLSAFFAQDDIPLTLLASAAEYLPRRFRSGLTDPLRLARTVGLLGRYSLAHVAADGISVHPLVQTVIREVGLTSAERTGYAARAVRVMRQRFPNDAQDVDYWPECARLATHGISVTDHAARLGAELGKASWLLDRIGTYIEVRVDSRTAIPYFENAVALAERGEDRYSAELAARLNNLASSYFGINELSKARAIFDRVMDIDRYRGRRYREVIPAGHLMNHGVTLYFIGEENHDTGLIEHGRELMEQAVQNADQSDSYFGLMLANLASEYRSRGDLDRASELAQLAREAEEKRVGNRHPAYAAALEEIAFVAAGTGDIDGAIKTFKSAAKINLDRLGNASRKTLGSYAAWFDTLYADQRISEATELADWMRENLDFSDPVMTSIQHGTKISASDVLSRLGLGYLLGGRPESALDCFYEAAAIIESSSGPESWQMALAENNVGFALLSLNRAAEAKRALARSVRLADSEKDILTPIYEANFAIALARDGDADEAMAHASAALAIEARAGTGDRGYIFMKVATAEIAAGRIAAARVHLNQALDLLSTAPLTQRQQRSRHEEIARMLLGL